MLMETRDVAKLLKFRGKGNAGGVLDLHRYLPDVTLTTLVTMVSLKLELL